MLDTLFINARIMDGTGAPWFRGRVGFLQGRVVFVEQGLGCGKHSVRHVVDVDDRFVTPGFIDMHAHMDLALLQDPLGLARLGQGVTTQAIGICGFSAAPLDSEKREELAHMLAFMQAGSNPSWQWQSFAEWLKELATLPLGGNVTSYVGHNTLRLAVMGLEDRPATAKELVLMQELLTASLQQGACGLSTGLIYPPGVFAQHDELVALAKVVREHGKLLETHMRNESDFVVECVRESIDLAAQSGVSLQIAHHKASGKRNFGKSITTLALVDEARQKGLDITLSQHPYAIGSTTLRAILPGWAQEGSFEDLAARLTDPVLRSQIHAEVAADAGAWDNYYRNSGGAEGVIMLSMPATPEVEGQTLAELSKKHGKDPLELAFDLIVANKGKDAAAFDNMSQDDIERIMQHHTTALISDSIPAAADAKTHPRVSGAFVHVLDHFVQQRGVLPFERAVQKMTSIPARRLNIMDRGLLAKNYAADLLIINPDTLKDTTTFAEPKAMPTGIDHVYVNGALTLEYGKPTGQRAGSVLRVK